MDTLDAFIFNSSTHWFAIRKINNIWFNLNSTNSYPGPQIISDFYLSAFVKGTEDLGYTNFLVKNLPPLPDINDVVYKNLESHQKLVSIDDILKHKPKKINMGDTDDHALEKAMELSKKEFGMNYILITEKHNINTGEQGVVAELNNFDESNLIYNGKNNLNIIHRPNKQL